MAKQEVVFSQFIQEKIASELGELQGRKVPVSEAIAELIEPLRAALGRGVPENDVLEVLKRNGIAITQKPFRTLVDGKS